MSLRTWLQKNQGHLSSFALAAGFLIDSLTFTSFHLDTVVLILAAYLVIAAGSLLILHMSSGGGGGKIGERIRQWFPAITAFALGSLLSGFLVFYSFVGSVTRSWPLVVLVVLIMIGNEMFHSYRSRLAFQTSLLFLVTFSFSVLVVPMYLHRIGPDTFVIAGACAIAAFWLFLQLIQLTGKKRYLESRRRIVQGAAMIFVVVNVFYFMNVIPPIPLSLKSAGVYHSVSRESGEYVVGFEPQSWTALFRPDVIHVVPGETIYAFTSVFAPAALSTTVVHRWEYYDAPHDAWITEASIPFPIIGGRDGGYRGYSTRNDLVPGLWRVNAETTRGQLIGRITFTVSEDRTAPQLVRKVIP